MNDRTPAVLALITVLATLSVYANMDVFKPGFEASAAVKNFIPWQGPEPARRSLELRRGLDLQGGLQVLLEAQSETGVVDPNDLAVAAQIIRSRIDILGVNEPVVQTQGDDKIVVELPGVADPDLAVRTIGQTALLEFIYAGDPNLSGIYEGQEVVTTEPLLFDELPEDERRPRLVDPAELRSGSGVTTTDAATETFSVQVYPTVLTGQFIQDARIDVDQLRPGRLVVAFELNSEGGRRLTRFTSQHLQEQMPIVLDKRVVSAPVIQATIGSIGQISGDFSEAEAQSLVAQLRSGRLPVALDVVGQTVIGPTLGQEAVRLSVLGGAVGMAAVMLFMLLYYRVPGLLANLALIYYVLLTLAIFRLIPVTLTLAGIAGFVLSIGMAVDANILIFERMKEEMRAGRSLRAAMDVGFRRAWPSIRDSNLSTLITCAILFWFGNQFGASIVKGFAVTLSIGVVTSLFTAITVTRTFLLLSQKVLFRGAGSPVPAESPPLKALFGI